MQEKKPVKLDAINRKILATIHLESDITNARLAELVNLSPAACSQRTKALRDAGYYFNCHSEVDLDRICEHVIAYVEFTLSNNSLAQRRKFEHAIELIPEFMDCLRLSGDIDYISFTCSSSIAELNRLCDELSSNAELGISKVVTRIVVDRPKFYLGYPIEKLKWLE
ncbi:Lrp/AsnC family transcriptional regulator [Halioglobus maricola]|uniref:Lrp/AsnC family transcriptional regulator n=1 Tax=Halioglobus maricola TaxID=2601894 RepID=A0A5P9NI83_9GAMM|nr:Lrp/AsnC family transcriptional regulator [Halioglobus maricola]QFU75236.1 Lrp/AsnC family transcriptional regulator [Halioglobus maricola]